MCTTDRKIILMMKTRLCGTVFSVGNDVTDIINIIHKVSCIF